MDREKPIYQGLYNGPDGRELTFSLQTNRCRLKCTNCPWPTRSSLDEVSEDDILAQVNYVLTSYKKRLGEVDQVSFGNEGSVLDAKTIQTDTLLKIVSLLGLNFPRLSLETHPIFINKKKIELIKSVLGQDTACEIAMGFETFDDNIRNKFLGKGVTKKIFENRVSLLANNGFFIKIYVMLKPSAYMDERAGVVEAIQTIKYIQDLRVKY